MCYLCIMGFFLYIVFNMVFDRVFFVVIVVRYQKPAHILRLNVVLLFLKQIMDYTVISKPDRIFLLNVVATHATQRLDRLLLRHIHQILPHHLVTKLIVRAINVVRRRDNNQKPFLKREFFHNLRIKRVLRGLERPDPQQQHNLQPVIDIQFHDALRRVRINRRYERILHYMRRPHILVQNRVGDVYRVERYHFDSQL